MRFYKENQLKSALVHLRYQRANKLTLFIGTRFG